MKHDLTLSPHVVPYRHPDGSSTLYNHLHRTGLRVPSGSGDLQDFERLLLQSRHVERLERTGFLKSKGTTGYQQYLNVRQDIIARRSSYDFTVHLSYDCNLACPYCYQSLIRGDTRLTEPGVSRIVHFMKEQVGDSDGDVYLTLIGGEPTLCLDLVRHLSAQLREHNLSLAGGQVVSNGFDVCDEFITTTRDMGIRDWMVTLDGAQERTDTLRLNPAGTGSFNQIEDTLKRLSSYAGLDVAVNMNLCQENKDDVEWLCQRLRSWGYEGELIFSAIFESQGVVFNEVLAKKDLVWRDAIRTAEAFGFRNAAFSRCSYMGCAMFSPTTFVIGADENLYSCINAVGNPKYRIGLLSDSHTEKFKSARAKALERDPHRSCCKSCYLVSHCGGGCTYLNDTIGFDCPKRSLMLNEEQILADHLAEGFER